MYNIFIELSKNKTVLPVKLFTAKFPSFTDKLDQ